MYRLLIRVALGFNSSGARNTAFDRVIALLGGIPDTVTKQGSVQTWEEVEVSGTYTENQDIQIEKIT